MVVDGVPNVRTCVTIAEVDNHFRFIPGTEKHFDVDTICLAVGLSPMSQLLKMAGCGMCVASCSGQAIFLVDETYEPGFATVTLPFAGGYCFLSTHFVL